MEITPLEAFIVIFSSLQLLLVGVLYRRGGWRKPTLFVTGLLFLINGLIGLYVVVAIPQPSPSLPAEVGDHWRQRIVPILDEPTNFLLILTALLLFNPRFEREEKWPRLFVLGLVAIAAFSVIHGVYRWIVPPSLVSSTSAYGAFVHFVPLYTGYSLLLAAGAYRFAKAGTPSEAGTAGLLLFGWGARPVQFGFIEGFHRTEIIWSKQDQAWGLLLSVFDYTLFFAAALVIGWVTVVCFHKNRATSAKWWVPSGLMAAAVLGITLYAVPSPSHMYQAAQLTTLAIVRPILVASAYHPNTTMRLTVRVLLWAASLWVVKAVFAASLGQPVFTFGAWDAVALPLGVMLAIAADRAVPRVEQTLRIWTASSSVDSPLAPPASNEERILSTLVTVYEQDPDYKHTAAQLAATTGVARSSVHRTLHRIRSELSRHAPEGIPRAHLMPFIKTPGGREHHIQLTPQGHKAAQRRLAEIQGGRHRPSDSESPTT